MGKLTSSRSPRSVPQRAVRNCRYCTNSAGAAGVFCGSAQSRSSPTLARRAFCVVTKPPIDPHSPLIRNNKFTNAANDRWANAPSEPGITGSNLLLAAFKTFSYTFYLTADSLIISLSKFRPSVLFRAVVLEEIRAVRADYASVRQDENIVFRMLTTFTAKAESSARFHF